MENSIIIIDDEKDFLQTIKRGLILAGFNNIRVESDSENAADIFKSGETSFDVALLDITMPGTNGIELLDIIKQTNPETECIMITAVDDAATAVQSLKKGAYDYLVKPVDQDSLVNAINRAIERKRLFFIADLAKRGDIPDLVKPEAFTDIITQDKILQRILKEAELHAASNIPVLITGESGTGKELLARAVHNAGTRASTVFVPVNMAALTGSLFDSEFFGHIKGTFTGADKNRKGYLEITSQGTLFLDEIGTLPFDLQGKLLRVIQEGEYTKLGTNSPVKTDARFITATNENLEKLVKKKLFRADLYYRLKGGLLHLPPLRERKKDIPLLVRHFIKDLTGEEVTSIDDHVLSILMDYDFPGNIRELKSIISSAINLSQNKPITRVHLPSELKKIKTKKKTVKHQLTEDFLPLFQMEKSHILRTYQAMNKNKSQTARILGIALNTLRKKLESYGEK